MTRLSLRGYCCRSMIPIHPICLSLNLYGRLQAAPYRGKPGERAYVALFILTVGLLLAAGRPGFCSEAAMKGPGTMTHRHAAGAPGLETSAVRLVMLGAIDVYRRGISPIQGERCGFHPTCSTFGRPAVREYGARHGGIMTADRRTRPN